MQIVNIELPQRGLYEADCKVSWSNIKLNFYIELCVFVT